MAAAGKENTTCAWTLLAMLPKFVLHAPYRGGRKGHTSYANHVLKCLERWQAREYASLWYDAISSFNNKQHSSPKTPHNDEKRAAIRTELLARQDEFSRGMAALTASPMAPESPETLSKLRNKHPCRLPCPAFLTEFLATEPPPTKCPPLQLTEQETSAAVKSFHRGSSGGTMGLCPEHIQEAFYANVDSNVNPLTALAKLVNHLLAGKAPLESQNHFADARLCALQKGEQDVRPIAVGETLRRLASKGACAALKLRAQAIFCGTQYGFAVPAGSERMIHRC